MRLLVEKVCARIPSLLLYLCWKEQRTIFDWLAGGAPLFNLFIMLIDPRFLINKSLIFKLALFAPACVKSHGELRIDQAQLSHASTSFNTTFMHQTSKEVLLNKTNNNTKEKMSTKAQNLVILLLLFYFFQVGKLFLKILTKKVSHVKYVEERNITEHNRCQHVWRLEVT